MSNGQALGGTGGRVQRARWPWLVVLAAWGASAAYIAAKLPAVPVQTNDSIGYIELAANRPPAYGWMLAALESASLVGPDYSGLPLVQTALISAGLLAFAVQIGRLLRAPLLSLAALLVWTHVGTHEATRWVASEGLFLPLLLFGLAACAAHARDGRAVHLASAGLLFGFATLTRTNGAALLLVPLLLVLLDGRVRFGAALRRVSVVAGVSGAVLLGGMWANMQRHGHFEIGSNTGVSILGKGLLVLPPGPHRDPLLDRMAPLAAQAREAVAAAPGFLASLRAQAQAYEALRWPPFFAVAAELRPEVAEAGERAANTMAARIARAAIADQPAAYLRLAARDWTALSLYPHFWPAGPGENSRLPPFDKCGTGPDFCWALARYKIPLPYPVAMLAVSAAGWAATVALLLGWSRRALRRALAPPERLMVSLALVAQASLVATALFEAGLWRYALPVHVIHIALAIWLATKAAKAAARAAARSRTPAAPGGGPRAAAAGTLR